LGDSKLFAHLLPLFTTHACNDSQTAVAINPHTVILSLFATSLEPFSRPSESDLFVCQIKKRAKNRKKVWLTTNLKRVVISEK
jgi:hypothetical protein